MTKLTKSNYHSSKNKYLSNSKIGDWLKDKRYFFHKHVQGNVSEEKTEALIIGDAVDVWLTEGRDKFERLFVQVERRNLKNPPTEYTELTAAQYNQIVGMCESVTRQTAHKELKGFKAQHILSVDMPIGLFEGLCGKPDWYKLKDGHMTIVDLKTTQSVDPKKYFYSCLSYGYFRQQAMYQILGNLCFGATSFTSYHLSVEKDTESIYKVQTFKLSQEIIEQEKVFIMNVLEDIKKEKNFLPGNVSFKDAFLLGVKQEEIFGLEKVNSVDMVATL